MSDDGRVKLGVALAGIAAFAPFWLPSPLSIGDFSAAFFLPFALAGWGLWRARSTPTMASALYGSRGNGLWIEMLCVAVVLLLAWSSMLVSDEPHRAFRVILPMTFGICVLIALTGVAPRTARRLVYAMMMSGIAVTAIGLLMMSVGGLRHIVASGYRFQGFFQNANQPALTIIAFWPIIVSLFLTAQKPAVRALCLAGILVLAGALVMTGTKTGLGIAFASASFVYLYHSVRTGSLDRSLLSVATGIILIAVSVPASMWVLSWANPVAYSKVNEIIVGGVEDYQSIQSRKLVWDESIRVGMSRPLLGQGAGSMVLGLTHSHNMILDYFRGMGLFGMISAVALLVCSSVRSISFFAATLASGRSSRAPDTVILGLYLGALGFLIGNQISDSFSPSTAFAFWMVYICAYLSTLEGKPRTRSLPRVTRAANWRLRAAGPAAV
jgi:hypothetical protein